MAAKIQSINLLQNKNQGFLDKFLDWALSTGRFIIIVTEVVALGTFLYRFSIDRQLVDLHDKIKQESLIVSAFNTDETTFRNFQDRIQFAKSVNTDATDKVTMLTALIDLAKGKVIFDSLTTSKNTITIDANAPSVSLLNSFVQPIKNDTRVVSVSINSITNRSSLAMVSASIEILLK